MLSQMSRVEEFVEVLKRSHNEHAAEIERDKKYLILLYASVKSEIILFAQTELRKLSSRQPLRIRDLACEYLQRYANKLEELSKIAQIPSMKEAASLIQKFINEDLNGNKALNDVKTVSSAVIYFAEVSLTNKIKEILRKDLREIRNIESELRNL